MVLLITLTMTQFHSVVPISHHIAAEMFTYLYAYATKATQKCIYSVFQFSFYNYLRQPLTKTDFIQMRSGNVI